MNEQIETGPRPTPYITAARKKAKRRPNYRLIEAAEAIAYKMTVIAYVEAMLIGSIICVEVARFILT